MLYWCLYNVSACAVVNCVDPSYLPYLHALVLVGLTDNKLSDIGQVQIGLGVRTRLVFFSRWALLLVTM